MREWWCGRGDIWVVVVWRRESWVTSSSHYKISKSLGELGIGVGGFRNVCASEKLQQLRSKLTCLFPVCPLFPLRLMNEGRGDVWRTAPFVVYLMPPRKTRACSKRIGVCVRTHTCARTVTNPSM